jgi:GT2 family glycosyltransferase
MSPTISVVIPHGGNLADLRRQLEALAAQTQAPTEIIVSCNRPGSYDEASSELESNPAGFESIILFDSSRTLGPSAARNAGWRQSKGEYVLFCDDDDYADSRWVEKLAAALQNYDVCAGSLEIALLNPERAKQFKAPNPENTSSKFEHLPYGPTASIGARRHVLQETEGFSEDALCAEDIDFCWRAQYAGFTYRYIPSAIMHYQLRAGLLAAFRRGYDYGIHDGWLLGRHKEQGAQRTLKAGLRQLAAIPYSLLLALIGKREWQDTFQKLGDFAGRVVSSVKDRIWVI